MLYCTNCDARIQPNTEFCINCGARISDMRQGIKGQRPVNRQQTISNQPIANTKGRQGQSYQSKPSYNTTKPIKRKNKISWGLLLFSLLMFLLGFKFFMLDFVGKTVPGTIDRYESYTDPESRDRDPYTFEVHYHYFVDDKEYHGHTLKTYKPGAIKGDTIYVRYLPFWPIINDEATDKLNILGIVEIGLGFIVFFFAVSRKVVR